MKLHPIPIISETPNCFLYLFNFAHQLVQGKDLPSSVSLSPPLRFRLLYHRYLF